MTDNKAGTFVAAAFFATADHTDGGITIPPLQLTSDDTYDGTWTTTADVHEHVRSGRYTLTVRVIDNIGNRADPTGDDLQARGLQSGVDVLSVEDTDAPHVTALSLDAAGA